MEEKVKALLGKAREDRYILRGLKHLAVRAKDYELGAHLRDLEKSVFGDGPMEVQTQRIEHKTFWLNDANEFDSYLEGYGKEGWKVDSKNWGLDSEDNQVFMAFLSREVPSSPPTPDEVKLTHNFRRAMIGIDNARHLVSSTDFTQEDRNRLILTQLGNVEAHVRELGNLLEKTATGGESNH